MKEFLLFLWKIFFYKEKSKTVTKKKPYTINDFEEFNSTGEILINSKNRVNNKREFDEIVKYTVNNKNLSQKELFNAIDINIKFLNNLLLKLENTVYITEYQKVDEMLQHSNTCLKILKTISSTQIFYKNTVEIIKKHTVTIGKLVTYINDLELKGKL